MDQQKEKPAACATTLTGFEVSSLAASESSDNSTRRRQSPDPKWRAQRNWNLANPDARRAHYAVAQARKKGKLIIWPCEVCGDPRVDCHHPEPAADAMLIICLCRKHHRRLHALLRRQGGPNG
ncbi:hypothetical protein [Mesorhizobium sp. M0619]|uniref:hypothetical protein n=1 Tax=unclassified Mesorhizobium TaxID=325217 RepID=UPI00333614FB